MEKCWPIKRERVTTLVVGCILVPLCAGIAVMSLIVFLWFIDDCALSPVPAYISYALGLCFGVAIFIGFRESIGIIVLSVISFVWIDGVYGQYPSLVCEVFGFGFSFMLYFAILGIIEPIEKTREYKLCDQGITIQYLGKYRRFYPWESIRNICVCTLFRNSDLQPGKLAIWCTAGKLRFEPPKGNANRTAWNSDDYIARHLRSILTMDYSPERLEEFEKYSKREIPDYREL